MIIELEVIIDLYSEPINETSQPKLVKKNHIYKKTFDTANSSIEEFYNNKGKIINKYSIIQSNNNYYKINKAYSEVSKNYKHVNVLGFISKCKKK